MAQGKEKACPRRTGSVQERCALLQQERDGKESRSDRCVGRRRDPSQRRSTRRAAPGADPWCQSRRIGLHHGGGGRRAGIGLGANAGGGRFRREENDAGGSGSQQKEKAKKVSRT